jgi:DNA anti-recombination protein RmuC
VCIECIFNYFLLPAMGAYAFYYFAWALLAKPLKELHARMLKNNEENRVERDELAVFRQTLCDEVEKERENIRDDVEDYKKIANKQLNASIDDMRAAIDEWRDPGQKIITEVNSKTGDMRVELSKHMHHVMGQVEVMQNEVNYMKTHKQDKP